MNQRISVIVPVYNTSKYIHKAIDSILNQTYHNIEVILVDDGSVDDCPRICDEYAKKDERVRVIHKPNGGLVSAWKAGVQASTGEYLSFVDSDDWIDENMLEELSLQATGLDREIIASDYVIERVQGDTCHSEYVYQSLQPGEYLKDRLKQEVVPLLLGNEYRTVTISRCMKLISRRLILDNMHYSSEQLRMAEDMSIILPALLDATRLYIMDHKAYYHYLYLKDSMVHQYDRTMNDSFKLLLKIVDQIISDKDIPLLREAAKRERIVLLLLSVKNEARGNKQGYREGIRQLHEENKELLEDTQLKVTAMSNRLLYRALKNPNWFNLTILRLAMLIYYRKR